MLFDKQRMFCFLFVILIFITGCTPVIPLVTENHTQGQDKTVKWVKIHNSDTLLTKVQQFYPDGSPAYIQEYYHGYPDGQYQEWYSNNAVYVLGKYRKGFRHGKWTYFDPQGRIDSTLRYKNGKLNGKYSHDSDDGIRLVSGQFRKGRKHKAWKWRGKDGLTDSVRTFSSGKLNGAFKDYYPNGSLKINTNYSSNQRHGSYREYSESKEMITKGQYNRSLPNGIWTWRAEGKKVRTITYANGVKNGDFHLWYPNGSDNVIGSYKNDLKNGVFKYRNSNGMLDSLRCYLSGKLHGAAEDYENQSSRFKGNLRTIFALTHLGTDLFTQASGVTKRSIYIDGQLVGPMIEWYPNGNKKSIINYVNGIKENMYQYWSSNGQLIEQGYYQNGNYHSIAKRWYSNGILSSESIFVDGIQNGLTKVFSPNGHLKKEILFNSGEPVFIFEYYVNLRLKEFTYYQDGEENWSVQWDQYEQMISQDEDSYSVIEDVYPSGCPKKKVFSENESRFRLEFEYDLNRRPNQIKLFKGNKKLVGRHFSEKGQTSVEKIYKDGSILTFGEDDE